MNLHETPARDIRRAKARAAAPYQPNGLRRRHDAKARERLVNDRRTRRRRSRRKRAAHIGSRVPVEPSR
ncbi:MAG: hypothetical protein ACLTSX_06520 [Collinsella sp.]